MNESQCSEKLGEKDKLDESNCSNYSFNLHNFSRISSNSFLTNIPGACQAHQKKKLKAYSRNTIAVFPQSPLKTEPLNAGRNKQTSKQTKENKPVKASEISNFSELAQTVGIDLTEELTKHIHTLLNLGVPSDDVYFFLQDCIKRRKLTVPFSASKIKSEK